MVKEVIKKDGRKEPFEPAKIRNSIKTAADETLLSEQRKEELAGEITASTVRMAEEKQEITTREIKEYILGRLRFVEPPVFDAWRTRESIKKDF